MWNLLCRSFSRYEKIKNLVEQVSTGFAFDDYGESDGIWKRARKRLALAEASFDHFSLVCSIRKKHISRLTEKTTTSAYQHLFFCLSKRAKNLNKFRNFNNFLLIRRFNLLPSSSIHSSMEKISRKYQRDIIS